jgi:hypothetical protein
VTCDQECRVLVVYRADVRTALVYIIPSRFVLMPASELSLAVDPLRLSFATVYDVWVNRLSDIRWSDQP